MFIKCVAVWASYVHKVDQARSDELSKQPLIAQSTYVQYFVYSLAILHKTMFIMEIMVIS